MMLILRKSIFYCPTRVWWTSHCGPSRRCQIFTDAPEKGYGNILITCNDLKTHDYIRLQGEFIYTNWENCFDYWAYNKHCILVDQSLSNKRKRASERTDSQHTCTFCPCVEHCSGFLFTMPEFRSEISTPLPVNFIVVVCDGAYYASAHRIDTSQSKCLNVSRSLFDAHNSKQ